MREDGKRRSLSVVAYEEIKNALVNNTYKQGTRLSEKQLCASLNMSRTPVREAIRMLVSEDLLEVRDGVGTFVKEQSQKDIEDAYDVRRTLEILAIRTAVDNFTEEELDDLENMFRGLLERYLNNEAISVEEFAETDWKLHDMIVKKSDNHYVQTVMNELRTTLKRYQSLSVQMIVNAHRSMEEHLQIVDCIRKKDMDLLSRVMDEHIRYG